MGNITVHGFKQLVKMSCFIGKGLEMGGVNLTAPVSKLLTTCYATKHLLTAIGPFTRLGGVFKPLQQHSVWSGSTSWPEKAFIKSSELAHWTMSNCNTYKWFANLGFVATRTCVDRVFNIASTIYIVHKARIEIAKWWTGKIINPLDGRSTDFTKAHKIKSLFNCMVICTQAGLTAIAVAQVVGYTVPYATFLKFALPGVAMMSTNSAHFYEKFREY